jgi:phenylalanyl-tRNA synthetase beta chain
MDFQLSHEWLQALVDGPLPSSQELASALSLHSVSVEAVEVMVPVLDAKVVVGRVASITSHTNADALQLVDVDDGSSHIRVVCGGTNLREGMLVAFAPIGSSIRWHGEGDFVELGAATIRGEQSSGMICGASEIGLVDVFPVDDDHEILDLTPVVDAARVGESLRTVLGFDDAIYSIEVTTNRPDLMSVLGLAREVSAITGIPLRAHDNIPTQVPRLGEDSPSLFITVKNEGRVPRYTGTRFSGVHVGPSPWWLQRRLLAGGLRPVNNVVDITNYVLLETGQPLHAFDAGAFAMKKGVPVILVRNAKKGESISALDGATYQLTSGDLVITDGKRPIAIAGVMGGSESAVSEDTHDVVLEVASFDSMSIRGTSRRLALRSESSLRFEKGLPIEACVPARELATKLLQELANGHMVGETVTVGEDPEPASPIVFQPSTASSVIGVEVPLTSQRTFLQTLGCSIEEVGEQWEVTPPWWRRGDLERAHDLVEEVARLHGYHKLASILPDGTLPASIVPAQPSRSSFDWEQRARSILAGVGGIEVMPFSLTSRTAIEAAGIRAEDAVVLENPLSENFAFLRPSLVVTLLPTIAQQIAQTPSGMFFELATVFVPSVHHLPDQPMRLLISTFGHLIQGEHVMKLRGVVEHTLERLGVHGVTFHATEREGWHPGRTMEVRCDDIVCGVLGEIHPFIVERASIDARVAACELDWGQLVVRCGQLGTVVKPLPFPSALRDLAVVVDRRTAYEEVAAAMQQADSLMTHFTLFDSYEGPGVPQGKKSLAFHLTYTSSDRTLTSDEVDGAHTSIIATLVERFDATVRE